VRQYRELLGVAARPTFDAPAALLASVYALMPARRTTRLVRLLSTSLGAGARRALPDDLQVVIEADGNPMRLMYARDGQRWEVLGKVPDLAWRPERDAQPLSTDASGRFFFLASTLETTGFRLVNGEDEIAVPSLEELLSSAA